jgi:hypothetical protein
VADTERTWTLTRAQLIEALHNACPDEGTTEDFADAILGQLTPDEVVHACPVAEGGLMPCCGQTPFEVPGTERMTLEPGLVTCRGAADGDTPSLADALKASLKRGADGLGMDCRGGNHAGCIGPPGETCACQRQPFLSCCKACAAQDGDTHSHGTADADEYLHMETPIGGAADGTPSAHDRFAAWKCPIQAVFGPDDIHDCFKPRGHEGPHSFAGAVVSAAGPGNQP